MKRKNTVIKEINKMFNGKCAFEVDGNILVTSENGQPCIDYYGEFTGGYPWVNSKLEKYIENAGWIYEWKHPGAIELYQD